MIFKILLIILSVFLVNSDSFASNEEIYSLIRVNINSKQDIADIMTSTGIGECGMKCNFDEWYIELPVNSGELKDIAYLGYTYQVLVKDLEKHYSQQFIGLTMGGFRTFSEIVAKLDSLHNDYPSITKLDSIGVSHQNNIIWAMKISDNPSVEEDEAEALFTGITHAREPIGGESCLDFIEWLCTNYGEHPIATSIVNNRQVWVIPVVNPDGYLYNQSTNPNGGGMWRKNRRNNGSSYGVDNNRNYTYNWGYDNSGSSSTPSSNTYRGPYAGSEPENQAVMQLCEDHDFQLAIHYHSGAEMVLHAWGFDNYFTHDQHFYRMLGDSLASFSSYPVGTTWQLLYRSNGNAYDYSYGDTTSKNRIFGFVCEAGPFWPSISQIPGLVTIHRNYNIAFAQLADNIWGAVPPVAPQIDEMTTDEDGNFLVSWDMVVADTLPDRYELQEVSGLSVITDGAENGSGNWVMDGFTISTTHHSGIYSYHSGTGNSYHSIMSLNSPIEITEPGNLTFNINYYIESNYDFGFVEVSTDGFNFDILATYTGNSGGWISQSLSLNPYVGNQIYIRFRYETDVGVSNTGFYVDNIYPVQICSSVTSIDTSITDQSYLITGKDIGTYAYRVRAHNAVGWGIFGNIEDIQVIGTGCSYIPGDVNGDGEVLLNDIVYAAAYFRNSEVPPPDSCWNATMGSWLYSAGDVNGNCEFLGSDITYLVSYFRGIHPALQYCPQTPPARRDAD